MAEISFAELRDKIDSMTVEEMNQFVADLQKPRDKKDEPVQPKFKAQLPNGQVVEGTPEEIQAAFAAYRPEPVQQQAATQQGQAAPPLDWSIQKFADLFSQDPREAMKYMELVQYGAPISQYVPMALAGLASLANQVQDMQRQMFAQQRGQSWTPETETAVNKIIQERGWQPSAQSLQDAYDIAKGRGLVKEAGTATGPVKPERGPQAPPRLPNNTVHEIPDEMTEAQATLLSKLAGLSAEDMDKLAIEAGLVSIPHLSR